MGRFASSFFFGCLFCLGRCGLGRPGGGVSHGGCGWLALRCCVGLVGCGVVWCRKHACLWWAAAAVVVVVVCCGGCPWCVLVCVCGGGMLSGFWGSAPWLPGLSGAPDLLGVVGGCGWVGCELYSGREHLTVRFLRQMFLFCSCVFVVCFFERSVDALASGADEGRGGLRYSSGSRLAGCDPRVSEWGDPARVMSCHLHLNCIGCGG